MESATDDSSLGTDLQNTVTVHQYHGQFLRLIFTEVVTLVPHLVPFFSILLEETVP